MTFPLNAVRFVDATHGWAAGDDSRIIVTSDGGASWTPQASGAGTGINGLCMLDAEHGWALGNWGTILTLQP